MLARPKIVIINALHRYSFYGPSIQRSVVAANQLVNGPEYILVNVDFETNGGGIDTLRRIAQLTAAAQATHQPIKIYQCVDYNAGSSGSPDSSIPVLTQYNQEEGVTTPLNYILDGSNAEARQRDEQAYGQGDYRFIMKFIPGLKSGLPPAPSPSPTTTSAANPSSLGTRSTSAPPAPIGKGVKKIVKKAKAQETAHASNASNQQTVGDGEEKETETTARAHRAVSHANFTDISSHGSLHPQQYDQTKFPPRFSQSTSSAQQHSQGTPLPDLVQVDITRTLGATSALNPVTVGIRPLTASNSPDLVTVDIASTLGVTSELNPVTINIRPVIAPNTIGGATSVSTALPLSGVAITLPTPPAIFAGNYEYPADQVTPPPLLGTPTGTVLGLFGNLSLTNGRRLHSPHPVRPALSPIVSRTTTPDQQGSHSHTPSPVHFGPHASAAANLNSALFPASGHKDSPSSSPHLSARTLGHGRNSPFKAVSPNTSPANSPNALFRRLNQRHPLTHTHFADSTKVVDLETEGSADQTLDATSSGSKPAANEVQPLKI